jgi:hypothetical protein
MSILNKDDLHTIKKFTKIHQNISGDEVIDDMFAKAEDEEELKIDDI